MLAAGRLPLNCCKAVATLLPDCCSTAAIGCNYLMLCDMPESMSSPIWGYLRFVSGVVSRVVPDPSHLCPQVLFTPSRSQYIPGSHSGGLAFHFVCRHCVLTWSVAFCSYKIQSEAFPLNIYKVENIRFAAHVFKFSCFRTIKIQPSPKRFDMVDVTMMWRGRIDFPA